MMFQGSLRVFTKSFKEVSSLSQGSFKSIPRKFQGNFKGFKKVLRVFQVR